MCHTEELNHWFLSRQIHFSLSGLYPLPHNAGTDSIGLLLNLGWWENGNVVIKTGPI